MNTRRLHPTALAQHRKAIEVFKAVCELDIGARARAIERMCGEEDIVVLRKVQSMLERDDEGCAVDSEAFGLIARAMGERLANEDLEALAEPTRIGPYTDVARIGSGGMGVVYRALQAHPRRAVALKTTHRWLRSPADLERFRHEVQALGSLQHPAIPRVLEAFEFMGAPYLVMELVEGERADMATRDWEPARVVTLLIELADAVQHATDRGLVHGDIKPGNVLVSRDGRPKLLDFGLSRTLGAPERGGGTAGFLSPGQTREDPLPPDARTDVFALGRLGERLLAGTTLNRDLAAVLNRATASGRDDRYASAGALRDDLIRYQSARPVTARAPTPGYLFARYAVRNRVALTAIGLILVAGLGLCGAWLLHDWRAQEALESRAEAARAAMEARVRELEAKGRHEEAHQVFSDYVALPEHQNTDSVARAWLERGRSLGELGRHEEERDFLGSAYTLALTRETERAALTAIVANLLDTQHVDPFAAAARLEAMGPLEPSLARELAVRRRDWSAVAEIMSDPDDRALGALLRGRVLGLGAVESGRRGFLNDRGQVWLYLVDKGFRRLNEDLQLGPLVPPLAWRERRGPWMLSAAPLTVLATVGDETAVWYLEGSTLERIPGSTLQHINPRDALVRGDWIYAGLGPPQRGLARWSGATWEVAHPPTNAADSDITDLELSDLDGDGSQELLAGLGPWRAFSVRALGFRSGDAAVHRADAQLGFPEEIFAFRGADGRARVGVVKTDTYGSVDVFGRSNPHGLPAGLYSLRFEDEQFVIEWSRSWPASLRVPEADAVVGDLDGDGLDDLLLVFHAPDHSPTTWLLRQREDGTFAEVWLPRLRPAGVLQADDDPALELIATIDGREIMLLGVEGETLRPVARALPPVETKPAATAAARAEALAEINLLAQASQQYARIAALSPADKAVAYLVRAGTLALELAESERRDRGRWLHQADEHYRAALARAPTHEVAHVGAARVALHLLDHARARHHLNMIATPWARALAHLARRAPPSDLIASRWRVHAPESVRLDEDGIRVRAFSNQDVILSQPVEHLGGFVSIDAALDVRRLELGAGVKIEMVPETGGEPALAIGLRAFGGGRIRTAMVFSQDFEYPGPRLTSDDPFTVTLGVAVDEDGQRHIHGDLEGVRAVVPDRPIPPGRYELRVTAVAQTWPSVQVADLTLRSLQISGPRPLGATTPEPDASIARGHFREALQNAPRGRSTTLELLCALEVGESQIAREALYQLVNDDAHETWPFLRRLLRIHHNTLVPLLAEFDPERLARELGTTWAQAARVTTRSDVQALLDGPVLDRLTSVDPAYVELILLRAELALERGQQDRALRLFQQIAAVGSGRPRQRALAAMAAEAHASGDNAESDRLLRVWDSESVTPVLDRSELARRHPEFEARLPSDDSKP